MGDPYLHANNYTAPAKKIMRLLLPYEKNLLVLVKQEDSLCLYTQERRDKKAGLFAAVQVISTGVAFTVYDPGPRYPLFDHLPLRLQAVYIGGNRFLITRITPGLLMEIRDLLSGLFGIYRLSNYYPAAASQQDTGKAVGPETTYPGL